MSLFFLISCVELSISFSFESFFEPYVETTYDETINDSRVNFYLDKDNRLYFYCLVGGNYVNLDEMPICTVDETVYEVKQATKGIYYIDINLSSVDYEENTMQYDEWSNLKYNGKDLGTVELQFVTKANEKYFTFGLPNSTVEEETDFIPSIYGIGADEKILRGDIRKVNIECKIPYTSNQLRSVDGIKYRLYVQEGVEELDVIKWQDVEIGYNENYFLINTKDLIPHRYFVDIKVNKGMEEFNYKNMLQFDIISSVNNKRV